MPCSAPSGPGTWGACTQGFAPGSYVPPLRGSVMTPHDLPRRRDSRRSVEEGQSKLMRSLNRFPAKRSTGQNALLYAQPSAGEPRCFPYLASTHTARLLTRTLPSSPAALGVGRCPLATSGVADRSGSRTCNTPASLMSLEVATCVRIARQVSSGSWSCRQPTGPAVSTVSQAAI